MNSRGHNHAKQGDFKYIYYNDNPKFLSCSCEFLSQVIGGNYGYDRVGI